jgi:hypothetical protein
MDRRLIERTLEVARQAGAFGAGPLRAALDSSLLWGAGRVEDTYNLLGHALRKALGVIADQQGWGLAEVAMTAKAQVLVSGASLKAALDRNWDDLQERHEALSIVLAALSAVETWLETQPESKADPAVQALCWLHMISSEKNDSLPLQLPGHVNPSIHMKSGSGAYPCYCSQKLMCHRASIGLACSIRQGK